MSFVNYSKIAAAISRREEKAWPHNVGEVLIVPNFLNRAFAQRTAEKLCNSSSWTRSWYVADPDVGKVHSVSGQEFEDSPKDRGRGKYRHGTLETIAAKDLGFVDDFEALRSELLSRKFVSAISDLLGRPVRPATDLNASRYLVGDFLGRHQDSFPGWVASFVMYLPPSPWNETDGGQLGLDAGGHTTFASPAQNTAAFIPLASNNAHWVSSVDSPHFSRLSLNFHLKAA